MKTDDKPMNETPENPVLFFAFANSVEQPLKRLSDEENAIRKILHWREYEGNHFHLHNESNANLDNLRDFLTKFDNKLFLFHYAGHAGSNEIFLDEKRAQASGIAKMLAEQKYLKLVFLNGCSTVGQVNALLDLGIPAVIATHAPVNDELATRFAEHFYEALEQGATLLNAYEKAAHYIEASGRHIYDYEAGARYSEFFELEDEPDKLWGLFHKNQDKEILEITLPDNKTHIAKDYPGEKGWVTQLKEDIQNLEKDLHDPSMAPEAQRLTRKLFNVKDRLLKWQVAITHNSDDEQYQKEQKEIDFLQDTVLRFQNADTPVAVPLSCSESTIETKKEIKFYENNFEEEVYKLSNLLKAWKNLDLHLPNENLKREARLYIPRFEKVLRRLNKEMEGFQINSISPENDEHHCKHPYIHNHFLRFFTYAMNKEEFENFCGLHYRNLYNRFTKKLGRRERIELLMDYVCQNEGHAKLLQYMQEADPVKFQKYQPYQQ